MAKFKKGQVGNPKGRPRGSPDWRTRIARSLQGDLPALLEKTKQLALEGDTQALRLLLERTIPPKKAEYDAVSVPELERASSLAEQAIAVSKAMGRGAISADTACQLLNAIANAAQVFKAEEFGKRLRAVEERQEQKDRQAQFGGTDHERR